ncbi:hypothetical protein DQ353_13125 [Arthrobacter sp. AQ5-05]|uniref:hypothetical protein n=1 Tax=Arthrobacter sp. AQ5-05 TaxID=2184581 RepID=UPI000DCD20CD|nr:hypothetical protein [Arthrobacter sp. AQ5-05]RAX48861.1 hypothetical protein DQ353_13125 [Arthrobacter sp. AQ5-05]
MGLFSAARSARRDNKELGDGVWRRAYDRFGRSLDRVHQILEGIEDDDLHNALILIANHLADLQSRVRTVCVAAQLQCPSDGQNIPNELHEVHRLLSKAANDLATTAQVAAMSRLDGERWGYESAGLENVAMRADLVADGIAAAEAELARH